MDGVCGRGIEYRKMGKGERGKGKGVDLDELHELGGSQEERDSPLVVLQSHAAQPKGLITV